MPSLKLRQAAARFDVAVEEDGMERNSLVIAHDILDELMERRSDLSMELNIEKIGTSEWTLYPWIGPAGEEFHTYRGSFLEVVAEAALRVELPQPGSPYE